MSIPQRVLFALHMYLLVYLLQFKYVLSVASMEGRCICVGCLVFKLLDTDTEIGKWGGHHHIT